MKNKSWLKPAILGAVMMTLSSVTAAWAIDNNGPIDAAIDAHKVGEQADGYLGFVNPPTTADAELVRKINDVNIRRRSVYTEVAGRISDTIERVAVLQAMRQIANTQNGIYIRDLSGTWCAKTTNTRSAQAADGTVVISCQ